MGITPGDLPELLINISDFSSSFPDSLAFEDFRESYVTKQPADSILYSENESQDTLKEPFGQTEFKRQTLISAKGQCCSKIEI